MANGSYFFPEKTVSWLGRSVRTLKVRCFPPLPFTVRTKSMLFSLYKFTLLSLLKIGFCFQGECELWEASISFQYRGMLHVYFAFWRSLFIQNSWALFSFRILQAYVLEERTKQQTTIEKSVLPVNFSHRFALISWFPDIACNTDEF